MTLTDEDVRYAHFALSRLFEKGCSFEQQRNLVRRSGEAILNDAQLLRARSTRLRVRVAGAFGSGGH
jgi:hypothetical protein